MAKYYVVQNGERVGFIDVNSDDEIPELIVESIKHGFQAPGPYELESVS